jgi:hypothetical protein
MRAVAQILIKHSCMSTSDSSDPFGGQRLPWNLHCNAGVQLAIWAVLLAVSTTLRGASSVTLAWDPNPESDISGYIVYYGNASRSYPYSTNVGNVTTATVYGLQAGLTNYFAITARNSAGLESDFSNEVASPAPASTTNQAPAISTIANRVTTEDTVVGPLSFQVSDAETAAANLTVSGSSTNTALVPSGNLAFGGSGSNRTVTVRPATNAVGRTWVTIQVSDGAKASSASFLVTVNASTNVYDQWLRSCFTAADLASPAQASTVWGANADPDKDGRDNLTEYALGLNPLSSESGTDAVESALVVATNRSHLTLTFPRRKNDSALVYLPQVSSNKVDWLSLPTAVRQVSLVPRDAEFDTVSFQDTTAVEPARPRFMRLRITKN